MVQHIVPRLASISLLAAGVLVWLWELALALLGAGPVTWSIIIASVALTFLAYFLLIWRERH